MFISRISVYDDPRMKKFLICLAPAILAYVIVVASGIGNNKLSEGMMTLSMVLIIIGGIVSGACVATRVYKSMGTEKWAKVVVSILCFLGVGIAYSSIGIAGCCGLAAVSGAA